MSSSSGDIVENMKILISQISRFCKKIANSLKKASKFKKWYILFLVISHILIGLQRRTIPHFNP